MPAIVLREPYSNILQHLGNVQQVADQALRQYAIKKAQQQIIDIQEKVRIWETKYGCSYDLFAYRSSTDESYVQKLNIDPETHQWEADLFSWEFYTRELDEWRQRLHNILTT